MRQWVRAGSVVIALGVIAWGCSGGSSSRGSGATSAAATSSSSTTTSATAGPAAVTSLLAPALGAADVRVAYRLTQDNAQPADVSVRFSTDGGQTWQAATAASGSVATTQRSSGPAPGQEHTWTWDTVTDLPGVAAAVVLEVGAPGGATRATLAVDNQPVSTHVTLNRLPFLQLSTPTSIVVSWRTETPTDTVVQFGPTQALGQVATQGSGADTDHLVTLSGLSPSTTYHYRIVAGGLPITPRYSFTSAPDAANTNFSFVVVGDSGMNNPEQYTIGARMATESADFFIHTGDVVYPAGGIGAAVREYNDRFFKPYQSMLTRIPAYPVVGNHDLYGLGGAPFKATFTLPSNGGGSLVDELYYSFEWGDAKFVAIETNFMFQQLGVGAHMTWLRDQLQNNTKKWLIVYMHTPLFSAGSHGDNAGLQSTLEPLFEAYKVDLVLTGHDHNYERTVPIKQFNQQPSYPGLVHIVTGGGGAALRPFTPNARTAASQLAYHYMRFDVRGDLLHGTAIDITGAVIDQFTVRDQ